ncbi:hypothetical protein Sru01_45460 [Sphaerisporangium rufum]|uniref:Uncharacterized protein n=1 Tax=Sphaerisporangium rufum TaxID=1381558 RepID=A0A919R4U4_9ACTN|nr:hypothetical protein [Sphaerisporangium rufum]GII79564.1 hypothetical protein Sru01_45460 [Sphaerisporangium rufum]
MRIKRVLALSAALTALAVGAPAYTAFSADGEGDCKNVSNGASESDPQCFWMVTDSQEALDIVRYWAENDGANMVAATPDQRGFIDCTVEECSKDGEGDGSLPPDGAVDESGLTPTCANGQPGCAVPPQAEVDAAARTPAGQAVAAAAAGDMRVWIDTELLDEYQAGGQTFTDAVRRTAALAAQPGVVGIRFSTQLGWNGAVKTAEDMKRFVTDTSAALRVAAPGKKLAVHTVLPGFGCGTSDLCAAEMAKKYPLLTADNVEPLLTSGAVDQLALDSGLLGTGYATWKISAEQAARNQWAKVKALAWDTLAQISAEDAGMAGKDASPLSADQAAAAAKERVVAPLKDGAATVNLWSGWKDASGATYRIMGAKLAATPAWDQLAKLQPLQRRLTTLYNPATPEVGVGEDLKKLSEVFGQVYISE